MSNDKIQRLWDEILKMPVEQQKSVLDYLAVKSSVEETTNPSTSAHTNAINEGIGRSLCDSDGTYIWRIDNVREKISEYILYDF